jgi:hypothetical protein
MEYSLTNLSDLDLLAAEAEVVTWQGHEALKLVNGLAMIRDLVLSDACIEVAIGAEGVAYPGVAFRAADRANYELGYAQPHTSDLWDAIQYDPVFHRSNTWQLYHGPAYQKAATVPTGQWFTLRVDVKGDRAAFAIDGQPALVVPGLMHGQAAGRVGLWTFRPAYFRDLRVTECIELLEEAVEPPTKPAGLVDAWLIEDFGRVTCEPNGVLNLNRYLPASVGEVVLLRQFETSLRDVISLSFGFSDELHLQLDGQTLFEGKQTFANLGTYESRGYVEPDQHTVSQTVAPGVHTLSARLKVAEPFGWGLVARFEGQNSEMLPVF